MIKTISFKQYLNEDIVPQKDNPRISNEKFESIVKTAKFMVDNGFANNFLKMADSKKYIVRGSDYHKNLKNESGMIGMVDTKRIVNRKSTYSSSQFIFNVWHIFKMPSRKRVTITSTSLEMANNFGEPFIFVPKQGVKIYTTPNDWNLGFKEQTSEVFGFRLKFGDLSYVFRGFTQLKMFGAGKYVEMFKPFNADYEITSISALKNLCDELDIFLKNVDIDTIRNNLREVSSVQAVIENLTKLVQEQDKSSFDLLQQLMELIKPLISVSTDIAKVLTSVTEKSEIWWTGDSFLIPLDDSDIIAELQNVLRQLRGKTK